MTRTVEVTALSNLIYLKMAPGIIWQILYSAFTDWRVHLYDAIAKHQLSYDALHALAGDLHQVLERVETEMLQAENRERHQER